MSASSARHFLNIQYQLSASFERVFFTLIDLATFAAIATLCRHVAIDLIFVAMFTCCTVGFATVLPLVPCAVYLLQLPLSAAIDSASVVGIDTIRFCCDCKSDVRKRLTFVGEN